MIAYNLATRSHCSLVWPGLGWSSLVWSGLVCSGDLTTGDLVRTEGTKQSFASYLRDLILTEVAQWTLMSSRVSLLGTFSRLV